MKVTNNTAAWLLCAAFVMPVWAQDGGDAAEAAPEAAAFEPLKYQNGDILLPNKVATLHLGQKYRYLDVSETNRLLMAWGNESDLTTQGAIVPAEVDPFGDNRWAVVLTYVDDGHVDDSDAAEIDYEELLAEMKKGAQEHNKIRRENNFPTVEIIGWAEPPHYDAATKKLYWAKEIDFEDSPVRTLNYDVRVLGREGVLSMNAVASMPQLEQVKADMKPLIQVVDFNPGYRYAEFNESTDKVAAYGLGALVAGAAAAKLGLFAKLAPFLKFIIFGVIAFGGFLVKFLGRKKDAAA